MFLYGGLERMSATNTTHVLSLTPFVKALQYRAPTKKFESRFLATIV